MTKNKAIKVKLQARRAANTNPPSKAKKKKVQSEVTAIGQALRALGGIGGGALGTFLGQGEAGGKLGTSLGATISRWFGQGDYTIAENSIVRGALNGSSTIPAMHSTGQSITVRHKEFIATINGSMNFTVQRFFLLQPGDTFTFPWLSGLSNKFQQYRIKGMVFHYIPTSGIAIAGVNPAIGSVMLQTSYRANDQPPSSKTEMMNEYWASESSPAETFCHPIECSPKENPFSIHYVRNKPVPVADSPLLYDMGVTYIATQGMQADNLPVGDLWVTYEIELSKPQVASSVLGDVFSGQSQQLTGVAPGTPFGTVSVSATGQPIPFSAVTRTITFPQGLVGTFIVNVAIVANITFTAIDLSGAPTLTNCTAAAVEANGNTYTRSVVTVATTCNRGYYVFGVTLSDPSAIASALLPACTWTGAASSSTITISPLA